METLQSKKVLRQMTEHQVGRYSQQDDVTNSDMDQSFREAKVGLYRTQRLAKSLLPYTCHDRGAGTRGRNAPLGRGGLLQ